MARPLRIVYPGAFYHVINRGNERRPIVSADEDREMFFTILGQVADRYNLIVHAYCLMDNHYHLLVETPDANLPAALRQLNGRYAQWFNRRHRRVGHLFQGRYRAVLVEQQAYLQVLARYIDLNPVRAGLVSQPEQWRWSSYRSHVGLTAPRPWHTMDLLLGSFGYKQRKRAHDAYRAFVEAAMQQNDLDLSGAEKRSPILGGGAFLQRFRDQLEAAADIREYPRIQRFYGRPGLAELFPGKDRLSRQERNERIVRAVRGHGYSMTEVASHLGLSVSLVSRVVAEAERGNQ